jgi:anti-sigma B factor antagonist
MPLAPAPRLRLEEIDDVTIVSFVDTELVKEHVLNEVRDDLYKLVDVGKRRKLLLNLGNVRKYSTEFLGNLLGLKRRLAKVKGELKLCMIAPDLKEAVKVLHLEKVFDIHDEEQKALDAF